MRINDARPIGITLTGVAVVISEFLARRICRWVPSQAGHAIPALLA
jgi:hypothetical protein